MHAKWGVAGLVALAGFALSITAGTYSAPTRSVDVGGNRLVAGVLALDLAGGDAAAELSFPDLLPGGRIDRRLWLANDPASPVPATLALTFDRLRDAAPAGRAGRLSGLLEVGLGVGRPGPAASGCTDTTVAPLPASGPGNLRALAGGAGRRIPLPYPAGAAPLVLDPGEGVCVSVSASWPPSDADGAAQGDSLTVRLVFELSQVRP